MNELAKAAATAVEGGNILAKIAREAVGNGEYLSIDDLIAKYPEGVTVNGAFQVNIKGKILPALTFEENPRQHFYAVAGDLGKIFESWVDYFCGDESKVVEYLKKNPVKLKIWRVPSSVGKKAYTKAAVVSG